MENPQILQVSALASGVLAAGAVGFHLGLCGGSLFPSIPLVLVGTFLESGWWILAPAVNLLHHGSPSKNEILRIEVFFPLHTGIKALCSSGEPDQLVWSVLEVLQVSGS